MGDREITYGIDRQGKPALLTKKESIAQQIVNAIFLAPGNIPNLPIGLNIEDYLFRESSNIRSEEVLAVLKDACGDQFISDNVGSIECYVVNMDGKPTFLLSAHLNLDDDEANTFTLVLTRQNDTVKFNHQFISEGIKKAYDIS